MADKTLLVKIKSIFSPAQSRANITSGEDLETSLGKISKWFSDTGSAAFKDVPSSGNAGSGEVVLGNDSRLSDARTPTDHTQASNTITAMTGYTKPQSTSAITASDTLNSAIGKLEKGLEDAGKEKNALRLGLRVDFVNKTFTRLGDAVGLNGGSDFDNFPMYKRRRCNLADDGTVNAYLGDENFAVDGSNGQVMVEQPKFYYKVVPLAIQRYSTTWSFTNEIEYWISDTPLDGYKLHPAFRNNLGQEINSIFIGAYESSNANNKLQSISGVTPNYTSRGSARTNAKARGTKWGIEHIWSISAEQLLMIIEFGKLNMQEAIGYGYVDRYSFINTGTLNSYGNGSYGTTENGTTAVQWRGKENPWGNIYEYIDGINMYGSKIYIAISRYFADDTKSNYEEVGFSVDQASRYISRFGYDANYDWLFIPGYPYSGDGDSALPVGDYVFGISSTTSASWRSVAIGGYYRSLQSAGPFMFSENYGATTSNSETGARLLYAG